MTIFTPEEVPDRPGFFNIPGFSRYCVSKDGKVLNKISDRELIGSRNPSNYHNFRLTDDTSYCYTYGRHRLLCDVFKRDSKFSDVAIVNHRNGLKGDDRLENLEWVTFKKNVEHAGLNGLTDKCIPLSVRDVRTGEVIKFPSATECAKVFGLTKDAILYRLRIGEKRVFPEMKQYRCSHEEHPWYIPESPEHELLLNGTRKAVMTRNVITNKIKTYLKITDLAWELEVSPSTLTMWLNRDDQPVLPGFLQLKWAHDRTLWRTITDPYLEMSKFTGQKPVVTINEKTGETKIHQSAIACSKEIGIKPTALSHRLKSNGEKVFKDGLRFKYYVQESQSPYVG